MEVGGKGRREAINLNQELNDNMHAPCVASNVVILYVARAMWLVMWHDMSCQYMRMSCKHPLLSHDTFY